MIKIEKVTNKDYQQLNKIFDIVFPDTIGFNEEYILNSSDFGVKLILDNEIIGFYMFRKLSNSENKNILNSVIKKGYKTPTNLKGLEGVALGVLPEYKKKGYGKMLIEYPYKLKYDFIIGQHFKHLKNIDDWLKRRIIFFENKDIFFTFGFLNKKYSLIKERKFIKTFENFRSIKYIEQPTGHSCGNTCIKMIYDKLNPDNSVSVEDLIEWCETDWVIGTTPERMILGLNKLDIDFIEKNGIENLMKSLENDKDCIVRTVTKGVPHWIIIDNYDNGMFKVLDPWLGEITYDLDELDSIWKVRDYYYFEI